MKIQTDVIGLTALILVSLAWVAFVLIFFVAEGWALLLAIVIFLIAKQIRIHEEEKLLREVFCTKFDDYRQRVPAFLPRIG